MKQYQVLVNGNYYNSFNTYSEATELRDLIQRQQPKAIIKIVEIEY